MCSCRLPATHTPHAPEHTPNVTIRQPHQLNRRHTHRTLLSTHQMLPSDSNNVNWTGDTHTARSWAHAQCYHPTATSTEPATHTHTLLSTRPMLPSDSNVNWTGDTHTARSWAHAQCYHPTATTSTEPATHTSHAPEHTPNVTIRQQRQLNRWHTHRTLLSTRPMLPSDSHVNWTGDTDTARSWAHAQCYHPTATSIEPATHTRALLSTRPMLPSDSHVNWTGDSTTAVLIWLADTCSPTTRPIQLANILTSQLCEHTVKSIGQ